METITVALQGGSVLFDLFNDFWMFVGVLVLVVGLMGMGSGSMGVASLGAYSVFSWIAIETGETFLESILIVTFVLIVVGFGFKIWRLEGPGGSE